MVLAIVRAGLIIASYIPGDIGGNGLIVLIAVTLVIVRAGLESIAVTLVIVGVGLIVSMSRQAIYTSSEVSENTYQFYL